MNRDILNKKSMHQELIKNIKSIKQRLGIGVITTLNGTDHHLMNQLDRIEDLVNKNFGLANVSDSLICSCGTPSVKHTCKNCGGQINYR
jgi:hypothetical protein